MLFEKSKTILAKRAPKKLLLFLKLYDKQGENS